MPHKEQLTVNLRSGRQEMIFVNLEAVYPTPDDLGTEMSFEELRAFNRGWLAKKWVNEKVVEPVVVVQKEISVSPATKMEIFQDEEPARIEVPEKMEVFRELKQSPVRPAKMQIFADEPENAPKPKQEKPQIFAEAEYIEEVSHDMEEKLKIARDPVADENGAVKLMLDENGNVIKEGRVSKIRKMKTMEVNETQISRLCE